MNLLFKRVLSFVCLVGFMAFCINATTPIKSSAIMVESNSALAGVGFMKVGESWTWSDLGGQVIGWAAAGAVAGAWSGSALSCPAAPGGALAGAGVGTVGGALSGAAYYAATQAWQAVVGSSNSSVQVSYLEASLD